MKNELLIRRVAAAVGIAAISGAAVVGCSQAKDAASSASSAASSAASAGASAASSAASAGASAASSAASAGASAASSVASGITTKLRGPNGDVDLDGPAADAYAKYGGEAALGEPSGPSQKVGDGTVTEFAKGTIFESPTTGAHVVQGEILKEYTGKGGPAGELGFPTADEAQTAGGPDVANDGWVSEFQKGTITWLNQGDGTFKGTITLKQ